MFVVQPWGLTPSSPAVRRDYNRFFMVATASAMAVTEFMKLGHMVGRTSSLNSPRNPQGVPSITRLAHFAVTMAPAATVACQSPKNLVPQAMNSGWIIITIVSALVTGSCGVSPMATITANVCSNYGCSPTMTTMVMMAVVAVVATVARDVCRGDNDCMATPIICCDNSSTIGSNIRTVVVMTSPSSLEKVQHVGKIYEDTHTFLNTCIIVVRKSDLPHPSLHLVQSPSYGSTASRHSSRTMELAQLSSPPFVTVEGASNIRSLGNYPSASFSSHYTKPNFAFRSGEISGITTTGEAQLKDLGRLIFGC